MQHAVLLWRPQVSRSSRLLCQVCTSAGRSCCPHNGMGAVRHTASPFCAQELEQELEPKDAELRLLGDQLAEQDAELVEELKRSSVSGSTAWGRAQGVPQEPVARLYSKPDVQPPDPALQRDNHAVSAAHVRLFLAALCPAWLPAKANFTAPASHAAVTGLWEPNPSEGPPLCSCPG